MKSNLILKENIMSMDNSYVWIPAGSIFKYFDMGDKEENHYACGTYIIKEKNIDLKRFL